MASCRNTPARLRSPAQSAKARSSAWSSLRLKDLPHATAMRARRKEISSMPNAVAEREPVETPITPNRDGQRILIIDDEAGIRDSLETLLTLEGFRVEMAVDGHAGLDLLTRYSYDLLLLDLALPGESGIDLLPRIRSLAPDLPIIMITAYGTVNNVVDAIRAGATNFIQKPWDNEKLLADIRLAIGKNRAEEEVKQLKRTLKQRYSFQNIVGKSETMLKLFDLIEQIDPSR